MKTMQLSATGLGLLSVLLLINCHPWQWEELPRVDPDCPVVTNITPVSAPYGAIVTIKGSAFQVGNSRLYEVRVGSELVDSLNVPDENTMSFKVPKGIGSGLVTVRLAGSDCEADVKPMFTYLLTATNVNRFAGTFGQTGSPSCPNCLNLPTGLEVDGAGNVWVADKSNNVVRQISPTGITTLGDNVNKLPGCDVLAPSGDVAHFNWPIDIAVNSSGDVFISEEFNFTIRKRAASGAISLYAGKCLESDFIDGDCDKGRLVTPYRIAQDGTVLYVADSGKIRKVDGTADNTCAVVSTFVEPQPGFNLTYAYGIEVSRARADDGPIFITDITERKVKSVTLAGVVEDITTGDDFSAPVSLAIDNDGNIFVADEGKNQIFVVYPSGEVAVLAGTGQRGVMDGVSGLEAQFDAPAGIAVDPNNNKVLYVADSKNHVIRKITVE